MQIFIKTLTGRKQQLNFEPDDSILRVKQALQEKEGIQVDQIRFVDILSAVHRPSHPYSIFHID